MLYIIRGVTSATACSCCIVVLLYYSRCNISMLEFVVQETSKLATSDAKVGDNEFISNISGIPPSAVHGQ